ncbi:hypothetical protein EW026_g5510 [Hermanssonia centrifuga]|uniref:Apurinic-apyrimidinic endonuclease 1 n=1 Tax=Hermanssonia centrifuga TaxID=98765 RepID=A0A4S4KI95_9APHY|nr:hypothetical protein EW026_g5510 [Hermanssonia centrifuga]
MATSLRRSSRILAVSMAAKLVASATKPIRRSTHITSPSADTCARSEDLEDVIDAYAEDYAPKKAKSPRKANTAKEPKVKKSKVVVYNLDEFPARGSSPWKIGPHVSAAGGVENAVLNAASIGATAFALFVKSQRKWTSSPLTAESIATFKSRMLEFGYDAKHVLPHGNYLVNLGNPDDEKREKSYECFLDDLKRLLKIPILLSSCSPGSTVGQVTPEVSLSLIAQCLNRAHKETKNIITVIESMAGAGNVLGSKFSELAKIIQEVEDKARVGVCLDTCHMFVAGYDIRTREGWENTMEEFEREIGIKYLRGMHLNDSKAALGSHKDRHENIGAGCLGLNTFLYILNDSRTKNLPLIMETPAHDVGKSNGRTGEGYEVWRIEIAVLKRLASLSETPDEIQKLDDWADEVRDAIQSKGGVVEATNEAAAKESRQPKKSKMNAAAAAK